ncbi:D-amino-acid transaminase [Anaerobacillus isosaccharinicus]|uniref:D-alanine aminotransferase n=1 Tax=Anaerobacillus isosaccharinicus TaxID=1532552 RepID=A0A1S2MFC5_9BACI|nr:D-amino-acid transaminase [Anaerobacillus isosaccharinicus]MBA5585599.1 D-amino-acid transaminase [Anaerobacillus isosaccharinicus]QOY36089.1 D-amino-acid transaminase [Anaerobacillus isosaccharinicus]
MSFVLLNNQITTRENVKIDMEDRGYNFGDGIYEVIPIYDSKTFSMDEHLQRFEESAAKIEIKLPYDKSLLKRLLNDLKEKNNITNGIIYIQMTRGVSPRAHLYERNVEGLITGFCREMPFPVEQKHSGINVFLTADIRWLRCDIKTINLLGNTMVKRKATDENCHEAIMHRDGTLTEGSSSNLFIVKDKILYTHPATNLILNGITRQKVIKLANENDLTVVEETFTLKQLREADEAFITSTTQEITPITSVFGDIQANFTVGPITKALQQFFKECVEKEAI